MGGRAETHVERGFHLNIGPHAVYPDAFTLLRELGVHLTGGHPPLGRTVAWYRGKRYRLPLGGASLLATGLLGVRAKIDAAKFFATRLSEDPAPLQSVTVRAWLESTLRPGPARDLAEALIRVSTYSNAPDIASAGSHLQQMRVAAGNPVFYVDGGWQTIVAQLRDQLIAAGGTSHSATRISAVEPLASAGWRVRTASGETHEAEAVIIAASPGDARRLLTGAPAATLQRWDEQSVPVRAAVLDIGLSRIPLPQVNYSIGIDRPLYFCPHEGGELAQAAPSSTLRCPRSSRSGSEANLRDSKPRWTTCSRDGAIVAHRRFLLRWLSRTRWSMRPRWALGVRPRGARRPGLFVR
jgi:phytoene dehydrogenase-like protein